MGTDLQQLARSNPATEAATVAGLLRSEGRVRNIAEACASRITAEDGPDSPLVLARASYGFAAESLARARTATTISARTTHREAAGTAAATGASALAAVGLKAAALAEEER